MDVQLEDKTAHIVYNTPLEEDQPELYKMLKSGWDRALLHMQATDELADLRLQNWEMFSSSDVGISFTNHLPQEEAFSINAALSSTVVDEATQYKDYFPAILVSPDKDRMFLFWERDNGNAVYVSIHSKSNDAGAREWFVIGEHVEIET